MAVRLFLWMQPNYPQRDGTIPHTYPGFISQGRAYVYHGPVSGLAATPALTLTGEHDGDRLGWSVASAGDVNGDGYADAIVGA